MSRFPRFGRCAVLLVLAAALPFLPVAGTARAAGFQLPPVTRVTLDNGLTVLVMPTRRLPLVDLRLVVRAGSVDDPAGKEGLAHLAADLMTQGAAARSAKQIAEDIEFVGGDLSAGADAERVVVTCEVLKKDLATGIEIFRDVIVQPTFGAAEFQRKKDEALTRPPSRTTSCCRSRGDGIRSAIRRSGGSRRSAPSPATTWSDSTRAWCVPSVRCSRWSATSTRRR
jgi:hypothetical protein